MTESNKQKKKTLEFVILAINELVFLLTSILITPRNFLKFCFPDGTERKNFLTFSPLFKKTPNDS